MTDCQELRDERTAEMRVEGGAGFLLICLIIRLIINVSKFSCRFDAYLGSDTALVINSSMKRLNTEVKSQKGSA